MLTKTGRDWTLLENRIEKLSCDILKLTGKLNEHINDHIIKGIQEANKNNVQKPLCPPEGRIVNESANPWEVKDIHNLLIKTAFTIDEFLENEVPLEDTKKIEKACNKIIKLLKV